VLAVLQFAILLVGLVSLGGFVYSVGSLRGYAVGLRLGEKLGRARRDLEMKRVQEEVQEQTQPGEPHADHAT
jgi:hypothetical protein